MTEEPIGPIIVVGGDNLTIIDGQHRIRGLELLKQMQEDLVSIARAVLGHAYPDKSFDELTPAEIEVVADCIHYADEVLAEVMPIVAEGRS